MYMYIYIHIMHAWVLPRRASEAAAYDGSSRPPPARGPGRHIPWASILSCPFVLFIICSLLFMYTSTFYVLHRQDPVSCWLCTTLGAFGVCLLRRWFVAGCEHLCALMLLALWERATSVYWICADPRKWCFRGGGQRLGDCSDISSCAMMTCCMTSWHVIGRCAIMCCATARASVVLP